MVLSRRSPEDRRLEPVRYASVWPNCSKGTTSHSRSNETTSARPLAIAAHAPARMNRESPSEGRTSEGTFVLSCCVVINFLLLSVSVAVAFCLLASALAVGHRAPRASERSPKAPPFCACGNDAFLNILQTSLIS